MILDIVTYPDPRLKQPCEPVAEVTDEIRKLAADMLETMYAAPGVGLAAPQVGILRRVVVIDVGEGLLELVNPEILSTEGEQRQMEGCLSVPGKRGVVARPAKVTVRALNRRGKPIEIVGEGFLAMALCHEIDHLDGVLYVDKIIEEVPEDAEE